MKNITNMQRYHIHIESHSSVFHINFKELWQYKDLIGLFTKRSFATRYKQTILGPAWLLLSPFITSVIYTLVFGQIAGLSTDGVPQILFYLGSTAIWTFFSSCLTQTAGTFKDNAAIFGKVYFPRLTMPISNVLSSAINFFISLLMFCFFWIYYIVIGGVHPNWVMLPFLLVILLQLGLLGLGFGIIISSLTTKYRDLSILITFGVQLWMYGTPVVYPISQIKDHTLSLLVHINPASQAVETFRYIFLGAGTVSGFWWLISWLLTIGVLVIGVLIFNKVEKTFMDTI